MRPASVSVGSPISSCFVSFMRNGEYRTMYLALRLVFFGASAPSASTALAVTFLAFGVLVVAALEAFAAGIGIPTRFLGLKDRKKNPKTEPLCPKNQPLSEPWRVLP